MRVRLVTDVGHGGVLEAGLHLQGFNHTQVKAKTIEGGLIRASFAQKELTCNPADFKSRAQVKVPCSFTGIYSTQLPHSKVTMHYFTASACTYVVPSWYRRG